MILIDGCFLRCHGRIIENLIDGEKLVQFDALSHYNRYTEIFDYEDVPEKERKEVTQSVADLVLGSLETVLAGGSYAPVPTKVQCGAGCGQSITPSPRMKSSGAGFNRGDSVTDKEI